VTVLASDFEKSNQARTANGDIPVSHVPVLHMLVAVLKRLPVLVLHILVPRVAGSLLAMGSRTFLARGFLSQRGLERGVRGSGVVVMAVA
jgi:hypothetical protein